jgi:hypothetical protein
MLKAIVGCNANIRRRRRRRRRIARKFEEGTLYGKQNSAVVESGRYENPETLLCEYTDR